MKVLWLQFHATNPPISFIFHIKCDPTLERFWFRQTLSTEALTFIRSCSFYFMIDQLTIFCLVKHRSLRIHFYEYLIFVQIGCCNQTTISWMVRRSLVHCVCRFERGIFMQNHLCMELRISKLEIIVRLIITFRTKLPVCLKVCQERRRVSQSTQKDSCSRLTLWLSFLSFHMKNNLLYQIRWSDDKNKKTQGFLNIFTQRCKSFGKPRSIQ